VTKPDSRPVADRQPSPGASLALPPELRGVAQLIDAGQFGEAREQLDRSLDQPADLLELMRLKLSVAEHVLEPSTAIESLLSFLMADPQNPAALELYRELSTLQYSSGHSCLSYSHPPPPLRDR
jgi:hypothetical protein